VAISERKTEAMKLADLIGTMKRHQDAGPNFNLARIAARRRQAIAAAP
jgi:hypothetical protein